MLYSNHIERLLHDLHNTFLRDNIYDEGDLIFYRINYRLEDLLDITRSEANTLHQIYHSSFSRRISQIYCRFCKEIVTFIPIIYGVSENELEKMKHLEENGRIIIGNTESIKEFNIPMFACSICKKPVIIN